LTTVIGDLKEHLQARGSAFQSDVIRIQTVVIETCKPNQTQIDRAKQPF